MSRDLSATILTPLLLLCFGCAAEETAREEPMEQAALGRMEIVSGPSNDYAPRYSRDADKIVYSSDRDGSFDIYVEPTAGGAAVKLTSSDNWNCCGALSPDGSTLAFSSDRESVTDLWLVSVDGENLRRLTFESGLEANPDWSPDGSKIAYNGNLEGHWNLYVINSEGGEPESLTDYEGAESGPSWSPDGSKIVFRGEMDGTGDIWVVPSQGGGKGSRRGKQPLLEQLEDEFSGKTLGVFPCVGLAQRGVLLEPGVDLLSLYEVHTDYIYSDRTEPFWVDP